MALKMGKITFKLPVVFAIWICLLPTEAAPLLAVYPDELAEHRFHPAMTEMDDEILGDPTENHALVKRADGLRLDRLIKAMFSPTLHRRRTRGIGERRVRGGWRPAFHRTGGTILLGKRGEGLEGRGGEEEWPDNNVLLVQQKPIPGLL